MEDKQISHSSGENIKNDEMFMGKGNQLIL